MTAQGSAEMDNNQQIKQMMSDIMAAEMVEVKEKVEEMRVEMREERKDMRAEMREKDKEMEELREEMKKGEELMRKEMQSKVDVMKKVMREEMDKKDNEVKKQLDGLEARNTELTTKLREVDQKSLRELPFVLTCAYKLEWTAPGTITYDRLTVDYNNSGQTGGGDGEMDVSTGKFTALTPGHYTVTYSGMDQVDPGEWVVFQLMKNGESVGDESVSVSYSSGDNGGRIEDQSSRTVVSV